MPNPPNPPKAPTASDMSPASFEERFNAKINQLTPDQRRMAIPLMQKFINNERRAAPPANTAPRPPGMRIGGKRY